MTVGCGSSPYAADFSFVLRTGYQVYLGVGLLVAGRDSHFGKLSPLL